jgi:hypothetical protein
MIDEPDSGRIRASVQPHARHDQTNPNGRIRAHVLLRQLPNCCCQRTVCAQRSELNRG